MAKLSNINNLFSVDSTGAIEFSTQVGATGYVLESRGAGNAPVWTDRDTGGVRGSGTENKVVRWNAAPATGVAQTIGDGPITFSGNNSTFGGTGSFADNLDATKSQNTATSITVSNTNAGSSQQARFVAVADSGNIQIKAISTANTTYGAGDVGVINCDTMSNGLKFAHNDQVKYTLAFDGFNTWTGGGTFGGNVTLHNILLTPATLPAINTPSISLRSTNNEIYFQAGSTNVFNFMKADYTTMLALDGTNSATFAGTITAPNLNLTSLSNNASSTSVLVLNQILGNELITNGDFDTSLDWSVTNAWTIGSGKATYSGFGTSVLYQTETLANATQYRILFTVSGATGNGAYIWIGNSSGNTNYLGGSYKFYSNGTHEEVFTMPSAQTTLGIYSTTGGSGYDLDTVSLKQVLGTGTSVQKREISSNAFAEELWEQNNDGINNIGGVNVGIGDTSPGQKLTVAGNISLGNYTGADFNRSIGINDSSDAYGAGSSYIKFNELSGSGTGTARGGAIEFYNHLYAGGTNRTMTLQANGNVGIGVTDPDYTLHLLKSSGDTEMYINGQNGQSSLRMGLDARNWQIKTAAAPYLWSLNYVGTDVPLSNIITANVGGNVGIGTDSPTTITGYTILEINNSTNGGILDLSQNDVMRGRLVGTSSSFSLETSGSIPMYFFVAGDNRMVINGTTGNVGIGTTSPGALLQVGDAPTSSSQQGAHIYGYDGALNLYTTRQGESPFNAALYLYNNPSAGTGTGTGILFRAKTGGGGATEYTQGRIQGAVYTSWTINTDATRTSKMVFRTTDSASTTDKVTILGNGNVGIGTDSPGAKLVIATAAGANTQLKLERADGAETGQIYMDTSDDLNIRNTGGSGDIILYPHETSGNTIVKNGSLGIGTTSPVNTAWGTITNTAQLSLVGSAYGVITLQGSATASTKYSMGVGNNRFYMAYDNLAGRHNIVVNSSGYVGIQDSSPSYQLDVTGTIRATGDVIAYSDARVKDNVKTIDHALEKITKLRGVSYTRNDIEDKSTKIGIIAQEVLEVLPEVVSKDDEGKYSVSYGNIVGVLIEAIKELKAEIEELKFNKCNCK